ncbi:hypothetical protein LTR16_002518, partial [Cryomyces antarcticus]
RASTKTSLEDPQGQETLQASHRIARPHAVRTASSSIAVSSAPHLPIAHALRTHPGSRRVRAVAHAAKAAPHPGHHNRANPHSPPRASSRALPPANTAAKIHPVPAPETLELPAVLRRRKHAAVRACGPGLRQRNAGPLALEAPHGSGIGTGGRAGDARPARLDALSALPPRRHLLVGPADHAPLDGRRSRIHLPARPRLALRTPRPRFSGGDVGARPARADECREGDESGGLGALAGGARRGAAESRVRAAGRRVRTRGPEGAEGGRGGRGRL